MTRKVYHEPGQSAHRSGRRQGMSRHLLSGRIKGTHRKHKTQQSKTHQEGKGNVRHCQLRSHGTVRGKSCGRMSCRGSSRRQTGRMEDEEVRGIPGDAREDGRHRLRDDPGFRGISQTGAASLRSTHVRRLQEAQAGDQRQEEPDQGQDACRQSAREHTGQGRQGLCLKSH